MFTSRASRSSPSPSHLQLHNLPHPHPSKPFKTTQNFYHHHRKDEGTLLLPSPIHRELTPRSQPATIIALITAALAGVPKGKAAPTTTSVEVEGPTSVPFLPTDFFLPGESSDREYLPTFTTVTGEVTYAAPPASAEAEDDDDDEDGIYFGTVLPFRKGVKTRVGDEEE